MHKSAEVKNALSYDEKLFGLNEENNKSKSAKNVEIKKETQELRPNSEIKTELAATMPTHNFIENSLIILTKQTLDIFLRQENPSELIALCTFYYYTAKWQQTNKIKCTSSYVAKGIRWYRDKVLRVKKQLIEFGLIEEIRRVDPDTKRVVGFYIRMNYIFKKAMLETQQIQEKSQCRNFQTVETSNNGKKPLSDFPDSGFSDTNALSDKYKNALSTNNNKYIRAKACASVPIEQKNKKCANNKCENVQPLIENKNTEPLSTTIKPCANQSLSWRLKYLKRSLKLFGNYIPRKKTKLEPLKLFQKHAKRVCHSKKYVKAYRNMCRK